MQVALFDNEDFTKLKHAHISRGILYEDEKFPCNQSNLQSLYINRQPSPEFKRPKDLSCDAVLRIEGPPSSICLGSFSNSNIILAMSIVAERYKLLEALFPGLKEQNSFASSADYVGMFQICFWIDGVCTFVVVDDILPLINGKIVYPHSSNPREFWPSILIKAYAKLLGGYNYLESIRLEDALHDLTGCVLDTISFDYLCESNQLRRVQTFEMLTQCLVDDAIVLLCTKSSLCSNNKEEISVNGFSSASDKEHEQLDEMCAPRSIGNLDPITGLCSNYAYMLTKTCLMPRDPSIKGLLLSALKLTQESPKERLLRLRSVLTVSSKATSFGEWRGAYSDSSKEWESLSFNERVRIGLVISNEAEFWMPLKALVEHFDGAVVCRLPKTGLFDRWSLAVYHGAWSGEQSGGGLHFRSTFLKNPQYLFEVARDTPDEVLISLTRKYTWNLDTQSIVEESSPPAIGFALLKVENNREVRAHVLSQCRLIDARGPNKHRATFGRYLLERGRYILVPYVENPLQEANYYLRFYFPRTLLNKELLFDQPPRGAFAIFTSSPLVITRVELLRAVNLGRINSAGTTSPYCRVSCEGSSSVSRVKMANNNPLWNECFLFYRAKPSKQPIKIEVLDKHMIGTDGLLGECVINYPESVATGDLDLDLYSKPMTDGSKVRLKGSLSISLFTVDANNYMDI